MALQELVARGEQTVAVGEVMVDGECQLDTTGAAADHHDLLGPARLLEKRKPALAELGDRLDWDGMLVRTGNWREVGRGADIERQHLIGERRLVLEQHQPARPVESDRFGMDQAGTGARGEGGEIDVAFVEAVAAGDEAREHAGIGCAHVARDQGDLHAGHGPLAEARQHMDVGMAAAHQHEILASG